MAYLALELDLGNNPGLLAGDLAGIADLVNHGSDQDAAGIQVRQGNQIILPRSICQVDPEVPLQQRGHRVTIKFLVANKRNTLFFHSQREKKKKEKEIEKEKDAYRFWGNMTVDDQIVLRAGVEESRYRRVVTDLLGKVEAL